MANEIRLRANNLMGTITDNPLTNVAVTINSPGFVDLPVVDTTNHIILTLDPTEAAGPAEIVRVTAHAAASSQVTVVRGAEGSAARTHSTGTTWFHGPVATDYPLTIGSTDQWLDWVPTLTNMSGTVTAKYIQLGSLVHYRFRLVLGTLTGIPEFTLPVVPLVAALGGTGQDSLGDVAIADTGTANYRGQVWYVGGSTVRMVVELASGTYTSFANMSGAVPMVWAVNDAISAAGFYEVDV